MESLNAASSSFPVRQTNVPLYGLILLLIYIRILRVDNVTAAETTTHNSRSFSVLHLLDYFRWCVNIFTGRTLYVRALFDRRHRSRPLLPKRVAVVIVVVVAAATANGSSAVERK